MQAKRVTVTTDASGAAAAASRGDLVVVVDVISMSTTLEAVLAAGAGAVFGASPDYSLAPVNLDPTAMGRRAGRKAIELNTEIILIGEPRIGTDAERLARMTKVRSGISEVGAQVEAVLPNIGAETAKMTDFQGKVVIAVTDSGGVAFDAAVTAGAPAVTVATIARTLQNKGLEPVKIGAQRAVALAEDLDTGITVVAASANSLEDVLAAEYIADYISKLKSPGR